MRENYTINYVIFLCRISFFPFVTYWTTIITIIIKAVNARSTRALTKKGLTQKQVHVVASLHIVKLEKAKYQFWKAKKKNDDDDLWIANRVYVKQWQVYLLHVFQHRRYVYILFLLFLPFFSVGGADFWIFISLFLFHFQFTNNLFLFVTQKSKTKEKQKGNKIKLKCYFNEYILFRTCFHFSFWLTKNKYN